MSRAIRRIADQCLDVCRLLNSRGLDYVVGAGTALHQNLGAEEDADVVVAPDLANTESLLDTLSSRLFGFGRELRPRRETARLITLLGNEPPVDPSQAPHHVSCQEASIGTLTETINGFDICYPSQPTQSGFQRTDQPPVRAQTKTRPTRHHRQRSVLGSGNAQPGAPRPPAHADGDSGHRRRTQRRRVRQTPVPDPVYAVRPHSLGRAPCPQPEVYVCSALSRITFNTTMRHLPFPSILCATVLIFCASELPLSAQSASTLPVISPDSASPPTLQGRWDFIPVLAPDGRPSQVRVTPTGDVWIATADGILRRQTGQDATLVSHWRTSRNDPVPSIISHDMFVYGENELLVSTIWSEVFRATPDGLEEVRPRGVRSPLSFAALHDNRVAVGFDSWRDADPSESIRNALRRDVVLVRGVQRLTAFDDRLFGITGNSVAQVNLETGTTLPPIRLSDRDDQAESARYTSAGHLLLAMTPHYGNGGCFLVDVDERSFQRLYSGPCYDLIETAPGDYWASTDTGIFRFDGHAWRHYFTSNRLGDQARFSWSDTGSLWIATTDGLWRHYAHTREVPTPVVDEVSSLFRADDNRLFVGYRTGAVQVLHSGEWRQLLQGDPELNTQPYQRTPTFAPGVDGSVWILRHDALYVAAPGMPLEGYPAPAQVNSERIATLAVCPDGAAYAGFVWTTRVVRFSGGNWDHDYSLRAGQGGSAVPDMHCDDDGYLWVLGTDTIAVRDPAGNWSETDTLTLRPNAKLNIFGALVVDSELHQATAWGAWGYPVVVSRDSSALRADPIDIASEMPYVFLDATLAVDGTQLILTPRAIFRYLRNVLVRVPLLDEQFPEITAFAVTPDADSAFGYRLDVAAESALFVVSPRTYTPRLTFRTPPTEEVTTPFLRLEYQRDGRGYPPGQGTLHVDVAPPLANGTGEHVPDADGVLTLTGLLPGETHEVTAQFTDVAGQTSEPLVASVTYRPPWHEDPRAAPGFLVVLLLALFVGARSPWLIDVLLRRLAGRHWTASRGEIDRTIDMSLDDDGHLEACLSSPGATLRLTTRSDARAFPIDHVRRQLGELAVLAPRCRSIDDLDGFGRELTSLMRDVEACLPDGVRYDLQARHSGTLMVDVPRELSDMPWDNLAGMRAEPIFTQATVSRVIRTDRVAAPRTLDGRLRAVVYAAAGTSGEATAWRQEQNVVATALRRAGVESVGTPTQVENVEDALPLFEDVDILHLVGHASTENEGPEPGVRFWLTPTTALTVGETARLLKTARRPPILVFINACGSMAEGRDLGGSVMAGLATPFLTTGAIVIGTQWPVQTEFAAEVASHFYAQVLPPATSLLWRWVRRGALEGRPFAEALAVAKRRLYTRRPYTNPTWSAYVVFGDPTTRLILS